ncbi:MAG: MBL fold metallo-hydrolase [Deltaproteobacteria bacterium]|nr:MBL fold metallo-hydrolase [Deltaproteobacteria bacterium]
MSNKAIIKFLGHATVLLSTEEGRQIMIDPWINGNPK